MAITRINQFQAIEGKTEALHQLLASIIPYIEGSDGCLNCQLLKSQTDTNKLVVLERWQSIEHHQASVANFPKEQMTAAMPLLAAPPTGDYYQ